MFRGQGILNAKVWSKHKQRNQVPKYEGEDTGILAEEAIVSLREDPGEQEGDEEEPQGRGRGVRRRFQGGAVRARGVNGRGRAPPYRY